MSALDTAAAAKDSVEFGRDRSLSSYVALLLLAIQHHMSTPSTDSHRRSLGRGQARFTPPKCFTWKITTEMAAETR